MANAPFTPNPTFNNDNPFPSIPAILDNDILTRVFTHRSFSARPNHGIFERRSEDPSPDNEKYESLGDCVVGLIVTGLLLDIYPDLDSGPYMKIRSLIIANSTLAAIFCRYALQEQSKLPSAQAVSLKTDSNMQAQVFKSYVGGLYLNQGHAEVEKWLKALFIPYMTESYIHVRAQHFLSSLSSSVSDKLTLNTVSPTPAISAPNINTTLRSIPGHLVLFNQQTQKEKREVKFHDDYLTKGSFFIWESRVEVDGKVLGSGKGDTKKAARNEAAKEALSQKNVTV